MILKTIQNAAEFLRETQEALEANEAANNLMYGLALRLQRFPERIAIPPFYAAVRRKKSLQAAALMTPPHNLVVFSTDPDYSAEAFELIALNLRQDRWDVPGVLGPGEAALAFAQAWQAATGDSFELGVRERVFDLRKVIPPAHPPVGQMRPAAAGDLKLAVDWIYDFHVESVPFDPVSREDVLESTRHKISDQDLYLWDIGRPVALAGRNRPTPNGYCIGPVYTPPAYRGKGYASALTAGLSQLLLDSGKKFTALFTDLSNPTSNSIYQKIGYRPICDFDLYRFNRPA